MTETPSRTMSPCPICGGTAFRPGPNGRLTSRKLPPVCTTCGSFERHRVGRSVMEAIRDREKFHGFRLLMLSDEPMVAKGWFASADVNKFGRPGAIDPQAIDRPDGSYDVIICCHLLSHVADHRRALVELMRVLSPQGLLFVSYPSPATREATTDWGQPDPARHNQYRILGRDFEQEYQKLLPDSFVIAVKAADPVTAEDDLVYLLTRNFFWTRQATAAGLDSRLI